MKSKSANSGFEVHKKSEYHIVIMITLARCHKPTFSHGTAEHLSWEIFATPHIYIICVKNILFQKRKKNINFSLKPLTVNQFKSPQRRRGKSCLHKSDKPHYHSY